MLLQREIILQLNKVALIRYNLQLTGKEKVSLGGIEPDIYCMQGSRSINRAIYELTSF